MGKAPVALWRCATILLLLWQQSALLLSEGEDAEVLLRLKSWVSRGNSAALSSWQRSSSSSHCSWSFISCLSGTRYVDAINLSECMHGEPLTKESEVYSFGVFVFELLTRQVPEMCMSMLGMPLEKWVRAVFPSMQTQIVDYVVLQTAPTEGHVMALLRVALLCTEENPKLRPRISEVINKLKKLSSSEFVPEEGAQNAIADV